MEVARHLNTFTKLPSTALAIGYHANFLSQVFDAFLHSSTVTLRNRGDSGFLDLPIEIPITDRRPIVEVLLPRNLSQLRRDAPRQRIGKLTQLSIDTPSRSFPLYVDLSEVDASGVLQLYDVPTTMYASKLAIDELFDKAFLAGNDMRRKLEEREIRNFETTLRILVYEDIEAAQFRFGLLD